MQSSGAKLAGYVADALGDTVSDGVAARGHTGAAVVPAAPALAEKTVGTRAAQRLHDDILRLADHTDLDTVSRALSTVGR